MRSTVNISRTSGCAREWRRGEGSSRATGFPRLVGRAEDQLNGGRSVSCVAEHDEQPPVVGAGVGGAFSIDAPDDPIDAFRGPTAEGLVEAGERLRLLRAAGASEAVRLGAVEDVDLARPVLEAMLDGPSVGTGVEISGNLLERPRAGDFVAPGRVERPPGRGC